MPEPVSQKVPSTFFAKRWIYFAQAIVFGGLAFLSLVMGPLFLIGAIRDARNQLRPEAGLALSIMSLPLMLVFATAVFNIRMRRKPVLRLFREGMQLRRIGVSRLDGVPVPAMVRVLWTIASLEAFRQTTYRVEWSRLAGAQVGGIPTARVLALSGDFFKVPGDTTELLTQTTLGVSFAQHEFVGPLDGIAAAIQFYLETDSKRDLASWDTSRPAGEN